MIKYPKEVMTADRLAASLEEAKSEIEALQLQAHELRSERRREYNLRVRIAAELEAANAEIERLQRVGRAVLSGEPARQEEWWQAPITDTARVIFAGSSKALKW